MNYMYHMYTIYIYIYIYILSGSMQRGSDPRRYKQ